MNVFRWIKCGSLMAVSIAAVASPLVYTPVNPNFGGNPMNGTMLMSEAQANNRHKAPVSTGQQDTQLDQFNQILQQAILGRLASSVTSKLVDNKGNLIPGVFETESFIIQIVALASGVLQVTTTDKTTGQSTTFQISSNP
ncbi:curli assembly protein CsgF [Burkholderiaceae bacterium DAT-1]|nr:curli assembly protein CsgF [Burkholderiaceae bacterium DAT-1]